MKSFFNSVAIEYIASTVPHGSQELNEEYLNIPTEDIKKITNITVIVPPMDSPRAHAHAHSRARHHSSSQLFIRFRVPPHMPCAHTEARPLRVGASCLAKLTRAELLLDTHVHTARTTQHRPGIGPCKAPQLPRPVAICTRLRGT